MTQTNFLITLILSCAISAFSQSEDSTKTTFNIHSKILNENVAYLYKEIGDIEQQDTVNLLLLLDGDEYFGLSTDIINLYVADESMKNTIVIGLPSTMESRWKYYTPTKAKPYENSDSEMVELFNASGEFKKYASFINTELIPSIETNMAKKITSKTIFGHSMGGLGAISFLIEQPDLFDNYIVASPSLIWDSHYILKTIDKKIEEKSSGYEFNKLFLMIADDDIMYYEESLDYFKETMASLKKNKTSEILYTKYENETHMTVGLRSLFDGILAVFKIK